MVSVFVIIIFVFLAFVLYLGLIRNTQVFYLRNSMLATIYTLNMEYVNNLRQKPNLTVEEVHAAGRIMDARWEDYEQVSYNDMVLKFWKPLKPEAFYDDTSFLR